MNQHFRALLSVKPGREISAGFGWTGCSRCPPSWSGLPRLPTLRLAGGFPPSSRQTVRLYDGFRPTSDARLERSPSDCLREPALIEKVRQFRKGALQAFMSGGECQPALRPVPKFTGGEAHFEGHPGVVEVGPTKLTFERWQIRQVQDYSSRPPDRTDRAKLRACSRDVVNITRVMAPANVDLGPTLNVEPARAAPLTNRLCGLNRA